MRRVFVDTSVLFPFSVMDLLLTLTENGLHQVLWTDELLEEWERVIVREHRRSATSAVSVTTAIREAFPETQWFERKSGALLGEIVERLDDQANTDALTSAAWECGTDEFAGRQPSNIAARMTVSAVREEQDDRNPARGRPQPAGRRSVDRRRAHLGGCPGRVAQAGEGRHS